MSVQDLFRQNPTLRHERDAVIYLVNWPCGFGSAIQIHLSNAQYIHSINPDIIVIPLFNKNSDHFKYHDETLNNSFFSYFNRPPIDVAGKRFFWAHATPILDRQEYKFRLPIGCPFNEGLRREFVWTPRLNLHEKAREFVSGIRTDGRPLVGVHVRAFAQKQQEYARYAASSTVKQRLDALKTRLDQTYSDGYDVFVATDVDYYIEGVKTVFGGVHWNPDIARVAYGHTDSIPTLAINPGIKLGDDILLDCLVLGMCDAVFVGPSNIPLLVWLLNPDAVISDY
jgi:hypothetical protein